MTINEVRVGNRVLTARPVQKILIPDYAATVQEITRSGLLFNSGPDTEGFVVPLKHVVGISLNEDWLHKLGFTFYFSNPRLEYFFMNVQSYYPIQVNTSRDDRFYFNSTIEIKYVHQLQNLFFDFTQEELLWKQ
jgi:hypothetical protein